MLSGELANRGIHLLPVFTSGGDDQLAVLYTAEADDVVSQFPNGAAAAFHDDDFQTSVMVKMHGSGGQNAASGVMRGLNQFFGQIGAVVVIDDGQGADDDAVGIGLPGDQVIADEVAHRLRTIFVMLSGDGLVKAREKFVIDGKSGSD
jgi:poly(3-hydroxybutyrate) depolymerase